ncbi:MAG: twin-arginine translocase subunit TatB [Rhodanobacteraceae bacterium]|nr:twin-arginine translocase subunit TatB [Rhodanobacteraceae bacterium]
MFDVGFSELVLIAVVALLVLGPERLPGAARTVGALLRKARQSFESVKAEVEREVRDEELKRVLKSMPQPSETLRSLSEPLERQAGEITQAIKSVDDGTSR